MILDSITSAYGLCGNTITALAMTALLGLFPYLSYRKSIPTTAPTRPSLVLDAISNNAPLYYFGVGSNLSRTKLENRSSTGKKIDIISMEAGYVSGYRLAFNMRGFLPLEPSMGSLEPVNDKEAGEISTLPVSKPLQAYEKPECHGSLVKLSPEDYALVYMSEGGGRGVQQGYEEVVVTCVPYDKSKPSVQAVAFRVRDHARLTIDMPPSKRYMTIIKSGGKELGLKPCYQKWLEDHPIQKACSKPLKKIAVYSIIFNFMVMILSKSQFPSFVQKSLLTIVYGSATDSKLAVDVMREVLAGMIMFPSACCGLMLSALMHATGKTPPGLVNFFKAHDED